MAQVVKKQYVSKAGEWVEVAGSVATQDSFDQLVADVEVLKGVVAGLSAELAALRAP